MPIEPPIKAPILSFPNNNIEGIKTIALDNKIIIPTKSGFFPLNINVTSRADTITRKNVIIICNSESDSIKMKKE